MHWQKRDVWKIGIIVGMLLFLVLITWISGVAVRAHPLAPGQAHPGMAAVQGTPTEDATVTVLNKEKLAQEVQQLKDQNEQDFLGWLRSNLSILLSTFLVVGGGVFSLVRYLAERRTAQDKELKDRKEEREKRAQELFQAAVTGLADDKEGAKIGATIVLRNFLKPGYEEFYIQIFDLAVANLRNPRFSILPEDPDPPLSPLKRALIVVFREAFPLARRQFKESSQSVLAIEDRFPDQNVTGIPALDAAGIQLDSAYLREVDLKEAWMEQASLRKVDLKGANLSEANLYKANLIEVKLTGANLSKAVLISANLRETWFRFANLRKAKLTRATLERVNFNEAHLEGAYLRNATLKSVNFNEAHLEQTDLSHAWLTETKLEAAQSLKDTDLRGIKGLTKEQLEACKAKGAIIDEDPAKGSSQPTVTSASPSQSNDGQASSTPPTQGSLSTPDEDGSGTTSSTNL